MLTFRNMITLADIAATRKPETDMILAGAALKQLQQLPFVRATLAESLRLYPQPPILIRRALGDDTLPPGLQRACGRLSPSARCEDCGAVPQLTRTFIACMAVADHTGPAFVRRRMVTAL